MSCVFFVCGLIVLLPRWGIQCCSYWSFKTVENLSPYFSVSIRLVPRMASSPLSSTLRSQERSVHQPERVRQPCGGNIIKFWRDWEPTLVCEAPTSTCEWRRRQRGSTGQGRILGENAGAESRKKEFENLLSSKISLSPHFFHFFCVFFLHLFTSRIKNCQILILI